MKTFGPAMPVPSWAPGLDRNGFEHARGTGLKCSVCLVEIRFGRVVPPIRDQGRLWFGCPCLYLVDYQRHFGRMPSPFKPFARHWYEARTYPDNVLGRRKGGAA